MNNVYKCEVSFRENSDPTCICKYAQHSGWEFGRNKQTLEYMCLDYTTNMHMIAFETNNFKDCDKNLTKDETNSYFVNCDCYYCKLTSNLIKDKFNICFCCENKIYVPDNMIKKCYECNCVLCDNCNLQGRYSDDVEMYCFNCRRFSIHKNHRYYFLKEIDMFDDWKNASWYY